MLFDLLALGRSAALLLLVYVAFHDVLARTIPDWVHLAFLLISAVVLVAEPGRIVLTMFGLSALVFAVGVLGWFLGTIGGGDVKLFPSVMLAIGQPWASIQFVMWSILLGGVVAGLYLAASFLVADTDRAPPPGARLFHRWRLIERRRVARRWCIPYAVGIAVAGFAVIVQQLSMQGAFT